MSNTVAVQNITPDFDNMVNNAETAPVALKKVAPVEQRVPHTPAEAPTLESLMKIYSTQQRECWLCEGVAAKIAADKEISEDDNWHFTSCVMSWEHLHRRS